MDKLLIARNIYQVRRKILNAKERYILNYTHKHTPTHKKDKIFVHTHRPNSDKEFIVNIK